MNCLLTLNLPSSKVVSTHKRKTFTHEMMTVSGVADAISLYTSSAWPFQYKQRSFLELYPSIDYSSFGTVDILFLYGLQSCAGSPGFSGFFLLSKKLFNTACIHYKQSSDGYSMNATFSSFTIPIATRLYNGLRTSRSWLFWLFFMHSPSYGGGSWINYVWSSCLRDPHSNILTMHLPKSSFGPYISHFHLHFCRSPL